MVTMFPSSDWDNDTCRPALDSAQILTSDVTWVEFHALLLVLCSVLPPQVAETLMKRNFIKWYGLIVTNWLEAEDPDCALSFEVSPECAVLAHV